MVKRKSSPVASSNKIVVYLQPGPHPDITGKEQPHEALANLQDDEAAISRFTKRWGALSNYPAMDAARIGFRDSLRKAWRGEEGGLKEVQGWIDRNLVTSLSFVDGRIDVTPKDFLGTIFLLFLRDFAAGRTAICANPDCAQPYILKAKAKQKFCESRECAGYAQRQYALKWWNEVGKQQREKRQKKAKAKGKK